MILIKHLSLLAALFIIGCGITPESPTTHVDKKLVIAHRGASGYLPEHTLAAKAMAYAQGADYIEQDLVMTKDDQLVVLHDHLLDTVTNVRQVFPGRARGDGRFYVIDFTLDEVQQLSVVERFQWENSVVSPVFKNRFPLDKSSFRIHTFDDEIELIQGLNVSTGRSVGLYPEIKSPAFHREEGKDIAAAVLNALQAYGYTKLTDNIYLQCFDPHELLRIHDVLMPAMNMALPLVQLLGTSPRFESILNEVGMVRVSAYAVGIGPSIDLLVEPDSSPSDLRVSNLVEWAHAAGLQVHPYTFRRDAGQIPPYATDFEDLLRIFLDQLGVDGVFTDFPDLAVRFIESET